MTAGFDTARCEAQGFTFSPAQNRRRQPVTCVALTGMGPKLLISDVSTADQPLLCWRFRVRGNTALEFGAVPNDEELCGDQKALHRCLESGSGRRAVGVCSAITVGSQLSLKVPVIKGSLVEIIARRGLLQALVHTPKEGQQVAFSDAPPTTPPHE